MAEHSSEHNDTPVIRLAIAWSFVGIPLIWGVSQTIIKAMALFD